MSKSVSQARVEASSRDARADFVALEAVERLESELMRISLSLQGSAATADVANARASVRRALQVTRELREEALAPRDGATPAARADALRARGIIAAVQSSELERAARLISSMSLPPGTFADVATFRDHVLGRVGRANARWAADVARLRPENHTGMLSSIDSAEAEFASIGSDPRVATFLAWGGECDFAGVRAACRVLTVVLGQTVLREEPTRSRFRRCRR